jgi:hypothetical protein
LPLAGVALLAINDAWLKPAFHSELTGKLSDIAVCFFFPLFISELLGLIAGWPPRRRLLTGAGLATLLYVGLEVVPPFTRLALALLHAVGPYLGLHRRFDMTLDYSDLWCVLLVPMAVWYGRHRLGKLADAIRRPDREP